MNDDAQIIFDAGDIKAIHQPAASECVVFSFNGMAFSGTGKRFFGDLFFARHGIAAVGLVDTTSTWFADGRVARAIDAITTYKPLRNGQVRLNYGASMGAYGALKYGRALDAHAALAVGPQVSIDPARVGAFDVRYRRFFDAALHRGMDVAAADLCPHNFVFFDPAVAPDREQAALLPAVEQVHRLAAPFIGHPGIVFFTQSRLLEEMFRLAATQAPGPLAFRRMIRAARRDSAEYWFNRAEYLRDRQPPRSEGKCLERRALPAYREALRLNRAAADHADTVKMTRSYADALLDAGCKAEGAPMIDRLWQARERGLNVVGLSSLLTKAGDVGRLRRIAEQRTRRQDVRPEALLHRARGLFDAGDMDGAKAAADAAREVAGTNSATWRRLRWLYQRLGREADVVAVEAVLATLDQLDRPSPRNDDPPPSQPPGRRS